MGEKERERERESAIVHSLLSCFILKFWSRTQFVVFGDAFSLV